MEQRTKESMLAKLEIIKSGYLRLKEEHAALQTKYDNILGTEDGHESKTENVWQSGYASGFDAGYERRIKDETALRTRADKMEQALKEMAEDACDYDNINFKSLHSTECRSCKAKQLLEELAGEQPTIPHPEPFNPELLNVIAEAEKSKEEDLQKAKEVIAEPTMPQQGVVTMVFLPCEDDDPRCSGGYTSSDGQCLCHVRESRVPVVEGAVWVTGYYDRLYDQLKTEPERKVVCWVDYEWGLKNEPKEILRDICSIMGRIMGFNARGIGYGGAETCIGEEYERKEFFEECERLHVEWLDESGEKETIRPTCTRPNGCIDWGACEKGNGCKGEENNG